MLASHAVNKVADLDADDLPAYCFLADLGGWLTFAAAMTTTLILAETAIDYLYFMFGAPHAGVVGMIAVAAAVIVLVDFALVRMRTRALRKSLADTTESTVLALRSIKVATIGTVVLAIVGSWLAVSLNRFPKDWLTTPNDLLVLGVVILTLALPTVVSTAICYSVASTDAANGRPDTATPTRSPVLPSRRSRRWPHR